MRLGNKQLNVFDLTNTSQKTVESEIFDKLYFICEKGGIKIFAGKDGALCLDYNSIKSFCEELKEIAEMWRDIDTEDCVMPHQQGTRLKNRQLCAIM